MSQPSNDELPSSVVPAPPPPPTPVRPSDYLRLQDEGEGVKGGKGGKGQVLEKTVGVVDIVDREQQEALVGISV